MPKAQELVIGRGGLRIPELETDRGISPDDFLEFFRDVWRANGHEGVGHDVDGNNKKRQSAEIVVPAVAQKPLVVMRYDYSYSRIDYLPGNLTSHKDWHRVVGAQEQYDVLTPPARLGAFEENLSFVRIAGGLAIKSGEEKIDLLEISDPKWLVLSPEDKYEPIGDEQFVRLGGLAADFVELVT